MTGSGNLQHAARLALREDEATAAVEGRLRPAEPRKIPAMRRLHPDRAFPNGAQ